MVEALEYLGPSAHLHRHRHQFAYAALVLEGSYEECGDRGRWRHEPGNVVVHRSFEAHCNQAGALGARVMNFRLSADVRLPTAFRVADPDRLMREFDDSLLVPVETIPPLMSGWSDHLAAVLRRDPDQPLTAWADEMRLSPETLSRGFRARYGISPRRYRSEQRALATFEALRKSERPLAHLAVACGYADQPHMTRAIVALTGRSPGAWSRLWSSRSSRFNTAPDLGD